MLLIVITDHGWQKTRTPRLVEVPKLSYYYYRSQITHTARLQGMPERLMKCLSLLNQDIGVPSTRPS
jgi:hypothetical protein